MAKQRGIHQISGKVNNLCYYEQKYVRGGLIRRINEAMSGRLKIDPVFENTRNANRLFGAASLLAKSFLQMFDAYSDVLTYPSRQAKLTKGFLGFIREQVRSTGNPEININSMPVAEFFRVTDSVIKNKFTTFFPSFKRYFTDLGVEERFNISFEGVELERFAKVYKAPVLFIRILGPYDIGKMNPNSETSKYTQPSIGGREEVIPLMWERGDGGLIYSLDPGAPPNHRCFYTVTIVPGTGDNPDTDRRYFSLACATYIVANVTY